MLGVEGSARAAVFEAYLEMMLAPTLEAGQVVVMDNFSAHKGQRGKEIVEGHGCELVYLPSYSPDVNPIEEAFSKIKGIFVRKAQARTRQALIEALGVAVSAISVQDTRGFFERYGYLQWSVPERRRTS